MDFSQDEYSGPIELLDSDLVAFFASRNSTPMARELALTWAEQISHADKVVISGFHSPLEREVLDALLKNNASVIVGLGRSLYKRIPSHLQQAFDEHRLLFLSFRNHVRHSASNTQIRNWGVAQLAQTLIFAPFDAGSSLSALHYTFSEYNSQQKIIHILGC